MPIEGSDRYSIGKYGLLNHFLVNLSARDENRDDIAGLVKALAVLLPEYGDVLEEMKHRLEISK